MTMELSGSRVCMIAAFRFDMASESTMMHLWQVSDLYSPKEQWASYVINAIKAKELHAKNVNYIVRNKEVSSNRATCKQSCWAGSFCLFLPKSMAPSGCPSMPLASPL